MLREAAVDPRRLDDYLEQIDRIDPDAQAIRAGYRHRPGPRPCGFSGFQKQNLEIEERRLMPNTWRSSSSRPAKRIGLRIEPRADGLWRIEHVPRRPGAEPPGRVHKLGQGRQRIPQNHLPQSGPGAGTSTWTAVLMGPGHPL